MENPLATFSYCSLHYSQCPVEIREAWTKSFAAPAGRQEIRQALFERFGKKVEFVLIATCNRFDLCLHVSAGEGEITLLLKELATLVYEKHGLNTSSPLARPDLIENYFRVLTGGSALRMLFRVAASLDSLVLGESHILGQVKDCYLTALEEKLCGRELSSVFNHCFQTAKRIRTDTSLGRNAISIGHAGVELASRVYEDLSQCSVLVVGVGEMGKLSAQHLLAKGVERITIANRTFDNAAALAAKLGSTARAITLETAFATLSSYDILIIATGSPQYLLRPEHFHKFNKARGGQTTVVVDISVPRNVDPAISEIDNLFLFDVDDLDKIMQSNRMARSAAAQDAEEIVAQEVECFQNQKRKRSNLASVGKFHAWVRKVALTEIEKSVKHGRGNINAEVVADAIAKKLISHSASLAKKDHRVEGNESVGQLLETLFRLKDQPLLNEHAPKEDLHELGDNSTNNIIPIANRTKNR